MSGATVRDGIASGARSALQLPALLALLSVLVTAILWRRGLELGDEGVISLGAWRILRGEVPYRDFLEIIPPLPLLAQAALFKLAGVTLAASRALAVLYSGLLAFAAWRLSARLLRGPLLQALPAATLVSCGVASWLLPSHHWLADLLALACALAALRALEGGRGGWAFAAGAAAGTCALTLQDQGALLAAGLLAWMAWAPKRGQRLRASGAALAGVAAAGAPVAVWLLPRVSPAALIYDWIVFPLTRYGALPGNADAFAGAWREVARAWATVTSPARGALLALLTTKAVLVLLVPAAAVAVLSLVLSRLTREERQRAGLLVVLLAAFYLPALRRPGLVNFQWALPAGALALAWALQTLAVRAGGARAALTRWVPACLILLFVGAGLAVLPPLWSGRQAYVVSRAGTAGPLPEGRARSIQGLLDALEAKTMPGEPVFCAGFLPMVNVLALCPNPAPLNVFVPPGYTTPEQVSAVIAVLEKEQVRWVVRPADFSGGERWDAYLADRFRPAYGDGRYELWKRDE